MLGAANSGVSRAVVFDQPGGGGGLGVQLGARDGRGDQRKGAARVNDQRVHLVHFVPCGARLGRALGGRQQWCVPFAFSRCTPEAYRLNFAIYQSGVDSNRPLPPFKKPFTRSTAHGRVSVVAHTISKPPRQCYQYMSSAIDLHCTAGLWTPQGRSPRGARCMSASPPCCACL
jgi:hypothetical protein